MTDFRQTWKHVDYLRLEVGLPHPTSPNILNTNNDLGAYGWYTPVPNTAIEAWGAGNPPPGWGGGSWNGGFRFTTGSHAAADVVEFTTVPEPITAGTWAASRLARYLTGGATATSVEIRTEFLNAAGGVLSASASTTATVTAAAQAPAGTASVRMVAKAIRAAVGTRIFYFNGEQIVTGTTAAAVDADVTTYKPYINSWTNVIGPTHSIEIDRAEIEPGTLTARILDATIDPAVSTLIRPGRPVRLNVANGFVWEPLFTGTVTEASVEYDLTRAARGDNKHAQITLAAVDNVATLGSRRMPYGVAEIEHVRSILEGAGVPWNVNGSRNQLAAVIPAVSINDSATMLDQVVTTRDSKAGYAWVNRRGVLNVADKATADLVFFGISNLVANPSFETSVSNWYANLGTLTRVDASYPGGTSYGSYVGNYQATTAANPQYVTHDMVAVVANHTYTGTVGLKPQGVGSDYLLALAWYNGAGYISTSPTVIPASRLWAGEFRRVSVTATAPPSATLCQIVVQAVSPLPVGAGFHIDAVLLAETNEEVAYFEGSVQQSFSERQYSSLDLAFSTRHLINEVNVKSLEWDPVDPTKTIEVIYGPYRNEASVREWGPQRREFTVNGLNLAGIQNLALAILIRNKTPGVYARTMSVPILTPAHIKQRALLDLYHLVAVGYEPKRFNDVLRVTGLRHTITEAGWVMEFTFAPEPAVAPPQVTPPVK